MELTHVMEYRFQRSPDGAVWTDTSYEYGFWRRYLKIFDSVAIVARVGDSDPVSGWQRVDGPGVRVVPVPHYIGPVQYALRAHQVHAGVQAAMNSRSAVLLRVPSQLGTSAATALWRQKRPYGVHVVGDPSEVFASGVVNHPLRRAFRWWFTRNQLRQCARAEVAWYVSPRLRAAYPATRASRILDCSDVQLDDSAFRADARKYSASSHRKLVTVATLSQVYKGIDVLIHALAICRTSGMSLDLTIVGAGKYQELYEAQAARLGIAHSVRFLGSLPAGAAVRRQLDEADIFILPSRTEGMPRAILEAMARALPCLASRVGGIPDVLTDEYLSPPGDARALAENLQRIASSPAAMTQMSRENLLAAHRFRADELTPQWERFLCDLLDRTRYYFRQHPACGLRSPVHA